MPGYEQERREFVRIRIEIPVRYKFLCKTRTDKELEHIYEGSTSNISGGGLLLLGKIPVLGWIPELLMQKIVVGCNIMLPDFDQPIKVLTRVAWIETVDEQTLRCAVGLRFKEVTNEDRDRLFHFVIKAQMPS